MDTEGKKSEINANNSGIHLGMVILVTMIAALRMLILKI